MLYFVRMKSLLWFFFCCIPFGVLWAQTDRPGNGLGIAYFNEQLLRPGLRVHYEQPLWWRWREKRRGGAALQTIVWKAQAGFYTHPRNHTGVFCGATIGWRKRTRGGLVIEPLHVGFGYLHSFLGADTYTVDDLGQPRQRRLAGNPTWMLPYLSLVGIGYDFRVKAGLPISVGISIDPFLQYPVNTLTRLRLSLPFTLTYFLP
jgi:hypothetical protein